MMRRCLSLLLAVILVLSMGTCAFASDTEEPAPVPVQEVVEVTPEPEIATEPEDVSEVEETTAEVEETTVVEETTIQEEVEEEEVGERLLPIYFWVDPLTGVCHSGLTYEQCIALIQEWIHSHPDLVLLNTAPTKDGDAAPAPGYTVKEEAAAPAESDAAPAEEAADYHVKFTVGEKEVEFAGGKDVSLTELLAALGIEVPEGAEVALDNSSVDTDVLTVAEKDGVTVLNSKGSFIAAAKSLIVLIDGVPTEISVTDDMSAKDAKGEVATAVKNKTTLHNAIAIESGKATIDLGGGTLKGDGEYVLKIHGDTTEVTIRNGIIDAAQNAVMVFGNAVVKFVNVTINAVKEALRIGDGSADGVAVTVDKDSRLVSKGENEDDDTDTVVINSSSTSNQAKVEINGTVVNKASGNAIDKGVVSGIQTILGWNAALITNKADLDIGSASINPTVNGASFSKEATADALDGVKLDVNYNCGNRYRVVTEVKGLGAPTRPGYRFLGWNSAPDGSGKSYTISGAMKAGVDTLYAMWENLNYYWLIPAVARPNGYEVFIATRMNVSDGVAKITFEDAKGNFLAPDSVGYKDVKNIINRGAKIARMQLDETLFFEMNLKDIAAAGGKNVNALKFFYEDGFVTVVSGQKVLFSVETALLDKATKDDVTLSFDEDGLVVKYGKATAFTIPMADLGENILLALKGDKLTAISISGLDVTKYGATKVSLADALAKGPIVKEYSK